MTQLVKPKILKPGFPAGGSKGSLHFLESLPIGSTEHILRFQLVRMPHLSGYLGQPVIHGNLPGYTALGLLEINKTIANLPLYWRVKKNLTTQAPTWLPPTLREPLR